jgi:hypothetical protein
MRSTAGAPVHQYIIIASSSMFNIINFITTLNNITITKY